MDTGVIAAIVGAVSGIAGTAAGSLVAGYFSHSNAKIQLEQAKLSIAATSSLAMLNQLAERVAPFFLAVEEMNRLVLQGGYGPDHVKAVAQKVNNERALLQSHLPQDLSKIASDLGKSFDTLASVRGDDIDEAVSIVKARREMFFQEYYAYRERLIYLAQPKAD
ncbi:hypothetical protein [Pseudomonas japonica]|uniref:hypothetical protein n=1 Tax=Pseudomonas japonica TaxID=256466 RepID=UPI0015E3BC5F|nr:hypothetical protein [Pseudomonas japonica]MBA1243420.1 hypothetical protein [Pseudomonas japonica]MBA1290531.1 hypothetical protein [Pseudomonas japonica]